MCNICREEFKITEVSKDILTRMLRGQGIGKEIDAGLEPILEAELEKQGDIDDR